jgi:sterol desaturase/sphingolipid hydroxylase (fatty acid hydroxylase superfamily)
VIDTAVNAFAAAQTWLFEHIAVPVLYALGLARFTELAFDATEWFLIGVLEIALLWALLRPLERLWPAQSIADGRQVLTDFLYTLLHRLGGFALIVFASIQPLADEIEGALRFVGFSRIAVDEWWPGVSDLPVVSFCIYLVIFDLADYWLHRFQHRFHWWWQLHAVHHSQRDMTLWTDNRNHLLDDFIRDTVFAALAIVIGVAPAQFVLLVVISRALQSLQHANVRLHFGPLEWLLVSPRFHRRHHAIGFGHDGPVRTAKRWGVNYAVLFPMWDVIFRTADFAPGYPPTGVRDQLPGNWPGHAEGRDYGGGFWAQQRLGLRRLAAARRRKPESV